MLIDLNFEVLDSIVKDGIQDMMKNVAGTSAGARKRGWYMNVKDAIKSNVGSMISLNLIQYLD